MRNEHKKIERIRKNSAHPGINVGGRPRLTEEVLLQAEQARAELGPTLGAEHLGISYHTLWHRTSVLRKRRESGEIPRA